MSHFKLLRPALLVLMLLLLAAAAPAHDEDDPPKGDPSNVATRPCVDGFAGPYPCRHVDLESFVPWNTLGGGRSSDVWGWHDAARGREYVLVVRDVGTSFFDVTDPHQPELLGVLDGVPSGFGDVKVYADHAFIVSDSSGSLGMHIFDLRRLRNVAAPPESFTADLVYREFTESHNLAINQESGVLYAVDTDTCNQGLHMVDVRDPRNPVFAGCFGDSGMIHDVQCVNYHGPDADYAGREICLASSADDLAIVDVTDKAAPRWIASFDYPGRGFVHQGWLTEDQATFLMNDESDEGGGRPTRTYLVDVRDLDRPVLAGIHRHPSRAIDHNLYVRGDLVFEANYVSGLRVLDLDDADRGVLREVAFFDVLPDLDEPVFNGAWTAYPYLPSGLIAVSSIDEGLFLLRLDEHAIEEEFEAAACPLPEGHAAFCARCGPCRTGEGDCNRDADCAAGLVCGDNLGPRFGFAPRIDVCVEPDLPQLQWLALTTSPELSAGGVEGLEALAFNNRGTWVGTARLGSVVNGISWRAVRAELGGELEDITPPGVSHAEAVAINAAGDVFGYTFVERGGLGDGSRTRDGLFLRRADGSVDFLRATPQIERTFQLLGMNGAGDLVGVVERRNPPRFVPYLHTRQRGWTSLLDLDPSFRELGAAPLAINGDGDILLVSFAEQGARDTWLLRGGPGGRLTKLPSSGEVNAGLALGRGGRVAGVVDVAPSGLAQPYFYRPEVGMVDLGRAQFLGGFAGWISDAGVAAGLFINPGGAVTGIAAPDTLFYFDERQSGRQLLIETRRSDFQALLPVGARLEGVEIVGMNARHEVVGRIHGTSANGTPVRRFFLDSRAMELVDLEELLRPNLGVSVPVLDVVGINDRGAILLRTGTVEQPTATVLWPQR